MTRGIKSICYPMMLVVLLVICSTVPVSLLSGEMAPSEAGTVPAIGSLDESSSALTEGAPAQGER